MLKRSEKKREIKKRELKQLIQDSESKEDELRMELVMAHGKMEALQKGLEESEEIRKSAEERLLHELALKEEVSVDFCRMF